MICLMSISRLNVNLDYKDGKKNAKNETSGSR